MAKHISAYKKDFQMKKIILALVIILSPQLSSAMVYTTTSNSLSFTVTGTEDVIVWATGYLSSIPFGGGGVPVVLDLDGTPVQTISTGGGGTNNLSAAYSLLHSTIPSSGTHTYNVTAPSGGAINGARIVIEVIDYSSGGGGGGNNGIILIDGIATEWSCTTSGSTTDCDVTDSSTLNAYSGPNFNEWLLVAGVIIFLISMYTWPSIFQPIKKIFYND